MQWPRLIKISGAAQKCVKSGSNPNTAFIHGMLKRATLASGVQMSISKEFNLILSFPFRVVRDVGNVPDRMHHVLQGHEDMKIKSVRNTETALPWTFHIGIAIRILAAKVSTHGACYCSEYDDKRNGTSYQDSLVLPLPRQWLCVFVLVIMLLLVSDGSIRYFFEAARSHTQLLGTGYCHTAR